MTQHLGVVRGETRSVGELYRIVTGRDAPTIEQAAIISASTAPHLVVAGAGSGKTETLSLRIVYLLDHARELFGRDIGPDEILCLTFTRKAAAEIARRTQEHIARVWGDADEAERPAPVVATYNAYAASLVSEHGLRVGADPDSTLLTDASLWQLASRTVEEWEPWLETDAAVSTLVGELPSFAAQIRDHGLTPLALRDHLTGVLASIEALPKKLGDPVAGQMTQALRGKVSALWKLRDLADLAAAYDTRKASASAVDFSDQVSLACRLAALPTVQEAERSKYVAVLLDEFQDTSPPQLRLFADLLGSEVCVMAVGDPNQAIYGFRGASAAALADYVETFGGAGTVVESSLSVSWRNEAAILAAANLIAAPLREGAQISVAELRSRGEHLGDAEPDRRAPGVAAHMAVDLADEARFAAEWIGDRRKELGADASAAVLCRRKALFGPVVEALRAAGIAYEVVGLGGLLDTPVVADLLALLEVAHDPSRGDSLMRLLTSSRINLGPRDLAALNDWAEVLAGPRATREDSASIVDALASPPPPGWVSFEDRGLGDAARERLATLSAAVAAIRAHTYLPLTELVVFAERAWLLDIEAALADASGRARRDVDAFLDAVRTFAASAERPTLGALLGWLAAARAQEGGLEAPVKDPEPGAVQVMTVHAAKGLEWDLVVVPGMSAERFPYVRRSAGQYVDSGWLSGAASLPWDLRLDRARLPQWAWATARDHKELDASIEDFRSAAGIHALEEERRLFYVALTRARSHALLSGSWFGTGKRPVAVSPFIAELADAGIVTSDSWAAEPLPDDVTEAREFPPGLWPRVPRQSELERRELARLVTDSRGNDKEWASLPHGEAIAAMLAERAERRAAHATVALPAHLSTSALVALRRDRRAFLDQVRRPMPQEPTAAAHRGSELHAWIEAHYGRVPLLLADDLGPGEGDAEDLERLKRTWEASEWADRTPTDVEVDVELPIAGRVIRSRIDAVFPPGRGLARVTVVDWKSGRPPRDPEDKAAREVQLAVYRLAWAAWKGLDVEDVDAAFYYVATDQTVHPERLLSREELERLVTG